MKNPLNDTVLSELLAKYHCIPPDHILQGHLVEHRLDAIAEKDRIAREISKRMIELYREYIGEFWDDESGDLRFSDPEDSEPENDPEKNLSRCGGE